MLVARYFLNRREIELQFVITRESVVASALFAVNHHFELRELLGRKDFLVVSLLLSAIALINLLLNRLDRFVVVFLRSI